MKYLFLILILSSCRVAQSFEYAPVKITTAGSRIHIQPTGKFKPMPDTTVSGYLVRRKNSR